MEAVPNLRSPRGDPYPTERDPRSASKLPHPIREFSVSPAMDSAAKLMGGVAALGGTLGSINIFVPGLLRPGGYTVAYAVVMAVLIVIGLLLVRPQLPANNRRLITALVFCAFPIHMVVTFCIIDARLYSTPLMCLFGTVASALLLSRRNLVINLCLMVVAVALTLGIGWTGAGAGLVVQIMVQSSVLGLAALAIFILREKSEKVLRQATTAARTDTLTGLANRRGVDELSSSLLDGAHRGRGPVIAAVIDLDYFKQVNDEFGHSVGDLTLQAVGDRLRAIATHADVVARIGGEEFIFLRTLVDQEPSDGGGLPDGPGALADCLHRTIAASKGPVPVTASIGVAIGWPDDRSVAERHDWIWALVSQADSALYEAKKAGRNCTRFAGSAPDGPVLNGAVLDGAVSEPPTKLIVPAHRAAVVDHPIGLAASTES